MNAVLQSTPNYVASKRSAPSPASQPTPSEQTLTRPNKRLKLTTITPPSTSTEANIDACATATNSVNAVIKRVRHAGTLRRLALSKPSLSSVRPASTLSGSKIGGKSKDLKVGSIRETKVGEERLGTVQEFWIGRKGMSFGGWLKKGIAAFVDERGIKTVHIHAIAAAMPMALSVALAIRDAVPGGPTSLDMQVKTGSVTVADEVTPDDEELDIIYQTRQKSTVIISLTATAVAALHAANEPPVRGRGSDRGTRRRGSGRGGRGGTGK